jgi:hypothetical protein
MARRQFGFPIEEGWQVQISATGPYHWHRACSRMIGLLTPAFTFGLLRGKPALCAFFVRSRLRLRSDAGRE